MAFSHGIALCCNQEPVFPVYDENYFLDGSLGRNGSPVCCIVGLIYCLVCVNAAWKTLMDNMGAWGIWTTLPCDCHGSTHPFWCTHFTLGIAYKAKIVKRYIIRGHHIHPHRFKQYKIATEQVLVIALPSRMKGHKQLILAVYVIVNGTLLGTLLLFFKKIKNVFFIKHYGLCVFAYILNTLSTRIVLDIKQKNL